jgi:predicted transcriptional regulator
VTAADDVHGETLAPYADLLSVLDALPLLLREARRRKGHSQRAAGRESGISFATICRIEARSVDPLLSNVKAVLRYAS